MWRDFITSLYPEACSRTYRVPPEHFNKVPYYRDTVPGTSQSALVLYDPNAAPVHRVLPASQQSVGATPVHNVPPSPQYGLWTPEPQSPPTPVRVLESDLRADFSQVHVMKNLQELGVSGHEAMFILSQLNFGSYLNKPSYAAAAAQLPRPINLPQNDRKGDFDVLVIHRRYGILIGELKAVGINQADLNQTQAEADSSVAKRVKQAVSQLDKSETLVKHLVSDIAPQLTVRKTLFLPYVTRTQLERVLAEHPQLEQDVRRSLNAGNTADAVQLCCCSDQLSHPATYWDVTPAVLLKLIAWWKLRMACRVDPQLTDDLYLDIVARFVGPATSVNIHCSVTPRVEVRTVGQAVAEFGRRLSCLVLTLRQLDLMHRSPPRVCLTGPPGTGKTILLALQGLRWLFLGHEVHVVSIFFESLASSVMIQHQLQETLRADPTAAPTPGTVRLHLCHGDSDLDKVISDLSSAVQEDMCVIVDEANISGSPYDLHKLVRELSDRVPNLCLWAAGVRHSDVPPALQEEALTTALRCAPAVQREVQVSVDRMSALDEVHGYGESSLPSAGEGPNVVRLSHQGDGHTGPWPLDCEQCGKNAAAELRRLGVGNAGGFNTAIPASLAYRDVFVLTGDPDVHDDVRDDAGNVTSAARGAILGLRKEGLPVCVLEKFDKVRDRKNDRAGWERRVADVAVAQTDQVTVAFYRSVHGLERPVVVWMRAKRDTDSANPFYRLCGLSRCTTQLVIVDPPPDDCDI